MLITAVCPHCRTSYQLQPSLRGQAVRCQNGCGKPFIVDNGDTGPSKGDKGLGPAFSSRGPAKPSGGTSRDQDSGSVSEMVEFLPSEMDRPSKPGGIHFNELETLTNHEPPPPDLTPIDRKEAPESASWTDAPPPVRRGGEPPSRQAKGGDTIHRPGPAPDTVHIKKKTIREPAPPHAEPAPQPKPAPPSEPAPVDWEPPPVRREPIEPAAEKSSRPPSTGDEDLPQPRRSRAKLQMAAIILGVVGCLGGGIAWVLIKGWENEEQLAAKADADYQQRLFYPAADKFQKLTVEFPDSERIQYYKFFAQLSKVRADLSSAADEPGTYFGQLEAFVAEFKDEPLLKEHAKDLRETVVGFSDKLADKFRQVNDDTAKHYEDSIAGLVKSIDLAVGIGKKFPPAELGQINRNIAVINNAIAKWRSRQNLINQLESLTKKKVTPSTIKHARELLAGNPDHATDAEGLKKIEELFEIRSRSVEYKPEQADLVKPAIEADAISSILINFLDPELKVQPGRAPANDPVVLALVRGVLYGLNRTNGHSRWAVRIGVDTATLPVRMPAAGPFPERILVLSSDTQTLTARDSNGNAQWEYRLDSPCLGRPVVDGQRAFLTTFDGIIHEIELAAGKLLGRYDLGQRLSMGATYDARTKRLYIAADDSCVYVIDTAAKKCESILYTWHPSGSLRSEPIVTTAHDSLVPSYLVLNLADGLDSSRLKVYALPINDRNSPSALKQDLRMPGWSWFRPNHDPEKLTLLTDSGSLAIIGVKQPHNNDDPLFPLLPGVAGSPLVGASLDAFLTPDARGRGRALVAHVQADDMWVMVHGKLQRVRVAWTESAGPQIVPGWEKPIELGSPLHESQVLEDPQGRGTLYLVTQSLARPTCLATAVDDDTGRVRWKRQLGLVCQGEPLVLTPEGGKPIVLSMDDAGSLFAFDTQQGLAAADVLWQSRGKILAGGFDENPQSPPILMPGVTPGSAMQIACPGKGANLVIRTIEPGGDGALKVTEVEGKLEAPLHGTPARVGDKLVLPLANGVLVAVPLPWDGKTVWLGGPDWRTRLVSPQAQGHVTALGGDRFVSTNGGRDITVWEWTKPEEFKAFPANKDPNATTIEMPDLITAATLALPAGVVVGDLAGNITLLEVSNAGGLTTKRQWRLKGRITAGPFLHGTGAAARVGVIVDRRRLVWIDPAKGEKPAWEHSTTGGRAIVGLPRTVGDMLVLVDQTGHYIGLDPATGIPKGPGYRLQGTMAPASSPVAFDADHVFAPLSDGTILLLPVQKLLVDAAKSK